MPPLKPLPDVLPFPYTGNTLHPTQKPVEALQPLIESFSAPGAIVLDPFALTISASFLRTRYISSVAGCSHSSVTSPAICLP